MRAYVCFRARFNYRLTNHAFSSAGAGVSEREEFCSVEYDQAMVRGRRGSVTTSPDNFVVYNRRGARPSVSSCVVEQRVNPVLFKLLDGCVRPHWSRQRLQRRSNAQKRIWSRHVMTVPAIRICLLCAPAPGRAPVPAAPPPAVSSTSERSARKHTCLRVCGGGLRACERGCACVAHPD